MTLAFDIGGVKYLEYVFSSILSTISSMAVPLQSSSKLLSDLAQNLNVVLT